MFALALTLWGCPKPTATPAPAEGASAEAAPAGARSDGPIAGPREVVEGSTPVPAPDTPGFGLKPPYVAKVRDRATEELLACLRGGPEIAVAAPALAKVSIGSAGELLRVELVRSSGSEAFDRCLLQAFRQTELPAPPPEILGEDGAVEAELAFR